MQFRRFIAFGLLAASIAGCGSNPGAKLEDARVTAYTSYNEAVVDFVSKNYAAAEPKLAAALEPSVLNPDVASDARVEREVCLAAAGNIPEALAVLEKCGPEASNQAEILAARCFVLKKQGKLAEANVALAQAKRLDPKIKEF